MQIEIKGMASGHSLFLSYLEHEKKLLLLDWLRDKKIPIASSCDGKGVCKKCGIQNGWLTCELTLEIFLQRQPDGVIEISYL